MNSHLILYNKQKKTGCKLYFMAFNHLVKKYTLSDSKLNCRNYFKKYLQFNNLHSVTIVHDLLVTKSDLSLNSG
jgi:hypothetical protein